jgi:hypothetical protein
MCDLWRYTIRADTPRGAIPAQISAARDHWRSRGERVTRIKLYNASNFFDPRAVPPVDYPAIAAALGGIHQVIVESHPSLIGGRVAQFRDELRGPNPEAALEVAMGLETVHPAALDALNKRMTTEDFRRAAEKLAKLGVSLRVFLLVGPPFVPHDEQDDWLLKSVAFSEECGASVISLIPARDGNGTMEALAAQKLFRPPTAADVQRSFDLVRTRAPRILLDPWAANAH